ncbi:MAG: hypothetical protein MZV49_01945 [Rhodopseudomonas palustris]|nr:hypothetical protein [Rhodopseudomonas palustris]
MLRSQRPDLVARCVDHYLMGQREPHERPDGLECRRHAHALPHALRIPAPHLYLDNELATGRLPVGGQLHRAVRHPRADVRGRHRARSRRAVAARSTRSTTWRDADDLTFLLTSGGHNAGIVSAARWQWPSLSGADQGRRCPLSRAGRLARGGARAAKVVVAGMAALAHGALRRKSAATAARERSGAWRGARQLRVAALIGPGERFAERGLTRAAGSAPGA